MNKYKAHNGLVGLITVSLLSNYSLWLSVCQLFSFSVVVQVGNNDCTTN